LNDSNFFAQRGYRATSVETTPIVSGRFSAGGGGFVRTAAINCSESSTVRCFWVTIRYGLGVYIIYHRSTGTAGSASILASELFSVLPHRRPISSLYRLTRRTDGLVNNRFKSNDNYCWTSFDRCNSTDGAVRLFSVATRPTIVRTNAGPWTARRIDTRTVATVQWLEYDSNEPSVEPIVRRSTFRLRPRRLVYGHRRTLFATEVNSPVECRRIDTKRKLRWVIRGDGHWTTGSSTTTWARYANRQLTEITGSPLRETSYVRCRPNSIPLRVPFADSAVATRLPVRPYVAQLASFWFVRKITTQRNARSAARSSCRDFVDRLGVTWPTLRALWRWPIEQKQTRQGQGRRRRGGRECVPR